jgi:hypothetical protein
MAEKYYGAPTRIGRIMMAAFGTPFILGALFLLGTAIFGDDGFGEKLPLVIGAVVFTGAGLSLWAPAFPGVVNRLLDSDNRFVKAVRPHAPPLLWGGMIILMGMVPVLAALGVIPTDDASWNAPRWVGGVAGGLFVVAGLYVLGKPKVDRLEPRLQKQILGLFPLLIVTGMAAISGWIAFGPGEREFESGASNALVGITWSGGSELIGRIAFGFGAVALIVIALIGWWKYLAGKW